VSSSDWLKVKCGIGPWSRRTEGFIGYATFFRGVPSRS
jgi:hypothetical protein